MRTSVCSWLAAAVVLSASGWCHAEEAVKQFPECTREPTESDTSAARGAFEAGQVSFQEADYSRAIMYWEDAFRRDCTKVKMLLNLSRAYESAGDKKNAVVALKTYLARQPNAPDKDQISRRIEVLEAQIERDEAAKAPVATAPAQTGGGTTAQPTTTEPTETQAPLQGEPEVTDSRSGFKPYWPLFVAGGGLVVGVLGAAIWGGGQSDLNKEIDANGGVDPRDSCPGGNCGDPDLVTASGEPLVDAANRAEDAEAKRNGGIVVTVVGAAALVGGGVTWYILRQKEQSTAVAPSIGPGYAGLSMAGRF